MNPKIEEAQRLIQEKISRRILFYDYDEEDSHEGAHIDSFRSDSSPGDILAEIVLTLDVIEIAITLNGEPIGYGRRDDPEEALDIAIHDARRTLFHALSQL